MSRPRVVVLARPGAGRDRTEAAVQEAGAALVAVLDPCSVGVDALQSAAPDVVLVVLDPVIESALGSFDAVLADPALRVMFDDADVASKRDGWEAARWMRHLAAKLHGHADVLPVAPDPDAPQGLQQEMEALALQVAAMPSLKDLTEIMERLRAAIFPGYFGSARVWRESMRYHLSANLDTIYRMLCEQIVRGFCFGCAGENNPCTSCESDGEKAAGAFMDRLPEIRRLLASDAKAAYEGDPAATSPGETIFCRIRRPIVVLWGKKTVFSKSGEAKNGPLRRIRSRRFQSPTGSSARRICR